MSVAACQALDWTVDGGPDVDENHPRFSKAEYRKLKIKD
jgi:hypothetical protein